MTEKYIETTIKKYINTNGGICKKIHSGAIMKSYKNKAGITRQNKIKLEDRGTTDLVAFIDGLCLWIEVKKNEEEYIKWLKYEERFYKEGLLPAYLQREQAQIIEKRNILECGGIHVLTYSSEHFRQELENYKKSQKTLDKTI